MSAVSNRLDEARTLVGLRRLLAARARYDAGSPAERARWRQTRLTELRHHAMDRSPLYGRLHRGLAEAPLGELPVVTKAHLFDDFGDAVTHRNLSLADLEQHVATGEPAELFAGRFRVGASSGSSGRPALFPFDRSEWSALVANAARAQAVVGIGAGSTRPRMAKVSSPSPWHLSHQVGRTLRDPRAATLRLSADRPVPELRWDLDRWQPELLVAYPSVLGALADEQLAGRLSIAPVQVLGGGEVMATSTRALVAEAWSEPFDQYVTTEAGFLAVECTAHQGLHVLDDHVLLEVVDADDQPVDPGELGERVLLTALSSRTLPLIRYALDDRVRLAEGPCPCGRPGMRLAGIEGSGRTSLDLAGESGQVEVHPVVLTSVLDKAAIGGWQVHHRPDRLRIDVARPRPAFDPDRLRSDVEAAVRSAGAGSVQVDVVLVEDLPRRESGKAALFVADRI